MQLGRYIAILVLGTTAVLLTRAAPAQTIHEIGDASGAGPGSPLSAAQHVATDADGNVYVIGNGSDNVLRIAAPGSCSTSGPPCSITEIMDASGDGAGNGVLAPVSIAVDPSGNVYVASSGSSNVHRIATPGSCSTSGTPCSITEIIDATGNGVGVLSAARGLAVDASGNVYVGGQNSSNAFKIATPGSCSTNGTPCTITEIATFHGAPGSGNRLDGTHDLAVDAAGNVYLSAYVSDNAFKIVAPGSCSASGTPCTVTEIIDDTGDGAGNLLDGRVRIAVDSAGNVYVSGEKSDNAFRIDAPDDCDTNGTPCSVAEIIDATGDGAGSPLAGPLGVASDASGSVYVAGGLSDNVFRIDTPDTCSTTGSPCAITRIVDASGDGAGNPLVAPTGLAMDADLLYVAASGTHNVFRVGAGSVQVPSLGPSGRALLIALLFGLGLYAARSRAPAAPSTLAEAREPTDT